MEIKTGLFSKEEQADNKGYTQGLELFLWSSSRNKLGNVNHCKYNRDYRYIQKTERIKQIKIALELALTYKANK